MSVKKYRRTSKERTPATCPATFLCVCTFYELPLFSLCSWSRSLRVPAGPQKFENTAFPFRKSKTVREKGIEFPARTGQKRHWYERYFYRISSTHSVYVVGQMSFLSFILYFPTRQGFSTVSMSILNCFDLNNSHILTVNSFCWLLTGVTLLLAN